MPVDRWFTKCSFGGGTTFLTTKLGRAWTIIPRPNNFLATATMSAPCRATKMLASICSQ